MTLEEEKEVLHLTDEETEIILALRAPNTRDSLLQLKQENKI